MRVGAAHLNIQGVWTGALQQELKRCRVPVLSGDVQLRLLLRVDASAGLARLDQGRDALRRAMPGSNVKHALRRLHWCGDRWSPTLRRRALLR